MGVTVFNGEPLDVSVDGVSISYGPGYGELIKAMAWAIAQTYRHEECPCDQCAAIRLEAARGEARH